MFAPPTDEELFAAPTEAELQQRQESPSGLRGGDTFSTQVSSRLPGEQPTAKIDKEIEDRSFFDKPALGAEETSVAEIEALAKKHGVDPKRLVELAPYFGARLQGADFVSVPELKRTAGIAGSVALGIPQKLFKMKQDPAMEAALDDVQALASGRSSYLQLVGEVAAPVGTVGKAATTTGKLLKSAAVGAVAGAAGAKQGQEETGAVVGAGLGAALHGVGEGVGALLSRKASKAEQKIAQDAIRNRQLDLEDLYTKKAEQVLPSENILEEVILANPNRPLSKEEQIQLITTEYGPEKLEKINNKEIDEYSNFLDTVYKEGKKLSKLKQSLPELEADIQTGRNTLGRKDELSKLREDLRTRKNDITSLQKQVEGLGVTEKQLQKENSYSALQEVRDEIASYNALLKDKQDAYNNIKNEFMTLRTEIEKAEKLRKPLSNLETEYRQKFRKAADTDIPFYRPVDYTDQLSREILEKRARDFAEELTGKRPASYAEAVEVLGKSQQGPEYLAQKYKQFVKNETLLRAIDETGTRATGQPGLMAEILDGLSGKQFVLRNIDDKFNTGLEKNLSDVSGKLNRMTYVAADADRALDNIYLAAKKAGIDDTIRNTSKITQAIESGTVSKLSPAEQQAAQEFSKYFENVRQVGNNASKLAPDLTNLAIEKRPNYVPHMLVDLPKAEVITANKLGEITKQAEELLGRPIRNLQELSNSEFKQLVEASADLAALDKFVRVSTGVDKFTSPGQFIGKLGDVLNQDAQELGLKTVARAALERSDIIPNFLREQNLYKLANKYKNNILKHAYLRGSLDQMRGAAKQLEKLGAYSEAKYVRDAVQDIIGVRKNTWAYKYMQGRAKMADKLDRIYKQNPNSLEGQTARVLRVAPEVMSGMMSQIYPNVLGSSLRAAINNGSSLVSKIIPELGVNPYSASVAARAAILSAGNFKKQVTRARTGGLMPAEMSRKGIRAAADSSLGRTSAAAGLDKINKASMFLHDKTEELNRSLVVSVGDILANDLANGSAGALSTLKKFPVPIQKQVEEAGSTAARADILGKYLNDVTQYNYGKASRASFVNAAGPLFSTFSTWPTQTLGDIVYTARSKGLVKSLPRNFEKYAAVWGLYKIGDQLIQESGDGERSDRYKKLVGSAGLSQMAPIGSLEGLVKGEAFTPPVVDTLYKVLIEPSTSNRGDTADNYLKGLGGAASTFVPGAGIVRFLTDDAVTLLSGERPEGSNFFERTAEGAKTITGSTKK